MIKSVKDGIAGSAPEMCEGCGCNSTDFDYRPEFDVYACENCHEKAIRAYMAVFDQ